VGNTFRQRQGKEGVKMLAGLFEKQYESPERSTTNMTNSK